MGWFNNKSNEYQQYTDYNNVPQDEHKSKISHELLGGAASYEAAKAYEDHVAKNGKPDSHARAKEILAGLTGAIVDREVETKGLNFIDREKAKHDAKKRAEKALADSGDY